MLDPIPRSEEPTAGSQAAAVSAGAAVVASSLRGAAASAHPIDRPMQLPQPDAAVREPIGSADISELLAGSPEKERADTGNAVEEHRRENRAGIETCVCILLTRMASVEILLGEGSGQELNCYFLSLS